jgi:hypothetical protein
MMWRFHQAFVIGLGWGPSRELQPSKLSSETLFHQVSKLGVLCAEMR